MLAKTLNVCCSSTGAHMAELVLLPINALQRIDQQMKSVVLGSDVHCAALLPDLAVPFAAATQAFDPSTILRWGAASAVWQHKLVVVGGYGGAGSHARRADVLIYDPLKDAPQQPSSTASGAGFQSCNTVQLTSGIWQVLEQSTAMGPCPRMGHAAVLLGRWGALVWPLLPCACDALLITG
jgi:hypothetical protein